MLREGLRAGTGREPGARLVWDAPHNLLWSTANGAVHRQGATPAGGYDAAPPPYDLWASR